MSREYGSPSLYEFNMDSYSKTLYQDNSLLPIDTYFAGFIQEISGDTGPEIFTAAALVSWASRNQDVCLDLNHFAGRRLIDPTDAESIIVCPELYEWRNKLSACSAVGEPGDKKPLILDAKNRLYFYRYWEYEKTISDCIKNRLEKAVQLIDLKKLKSDIDAVFPDQDTEDINKQKLACLSAVMNRFCVISGGPGTGKTTTIAKILTLLGKHSGNYEIRILLCAPTGKAAAGLSERMMKEKSAPGCHDDVKRYLPHEAYTIHRMLKPISGTPYFRHNAENLLSADVVVIDEASMVDVALMSKLFLAIPDHARIILVGDKDQLSSVEAGSVLGDICDRDAVHGMSRHFVNTVNPYFRADLSLHIPGLEPGRGIHDHIVVLNRNYRFNEKSGIGGLSRVINRGDAHTAVGMLMNKTEGNIELKEITKGESLYDMLKPRVLERYSQYLTADEPIRALELFNQFKILCAIKIGSFGVFTINRMVERILHDHGLIYPENRYSEQWYKGRPVLITRNDYSTGLFNGDMGIALPEINTKSGTLKIIFPVKSGEVRQVPISRLPEHETVYAMTIHKSQGSEFKDVLIILPDKHYPILTRELIYTGVTRATNSVTIWGKKEVLKEAIMNRIERTSGLRDSLWG